MLDVVSVHFPDLLISTQSLTDVRRSSVFGNTREDCSQTAGAVILRREIIFSYSFRLSRVLRKQSCKLAMKEIHKEGSVFGTDIFDDDHL